MKLEDIKNKTKDAVDYLVQSLESGHSEVLTQYLGAMARFHTYSFGNVMLIARQKPDASNVAGIRTWNSLGRFVKRGEKGILILAPMVGKKRTQNEGAEPTEDAKSTESTLFGFRAVYVFDITQTEGKELPTLNEVEGDVSGYRERLVQFVASQGIELNYSERIGPAKGLSHGGKITLLLGMQPAEEFSTLVHEIGHLCGAESYVAFALESTEGRAPCAENDHISNAAALVKSHLGRRLLFLDGLSPHQPLPDRLGGREDWRNGRNVGKRPCELALG